MVQFRFKNHYECVIRPDLMIKLNVTNVHSLPMIKEIKLHMNINETINDKKAILPAFILLERIAGQRPTVTRARKSMAAFQLKEDMILGCKASLRGTAMHSFLDKLVTIVLPRLRDFQGFKYNGFDQHCSATFGIPDLLVFPEIETEFDRFSKFHGIDIHLITNAQTVLDARTLLSAYQIPFTELIKN